MSFIRGVLRCAQDDIVFMKRPLVKCLAAFVALGLLPPIVAKAAENPYDLLGQTLAPFINLLAKNSRTPDRAVTIELRVLEATGLPPELAHTTASISLEAPDKLRLSGPVLGEQVTLCRRGQELWAVPGAKIEALIKRGDLPKAKKKYKLADFELPIPEKQLVFLPVLFQVAAEADDEVNGVKCRVLDVRLMPELAHALKVEAWTARLWVGADHKPVKIDFRQPEWHGVFVFDKVEFAPSLPPETWQPPSGEADVLTLTPQRFKQLLDAAIGTTRSKSE